MNDLPKEQIQSSPYNQYRYTEFDIMQLLNIPKEMLDKLKLRESEKLVLIEHYIMQGGNYLFNDKGFYILGYGRYYLLQEE